jgi:hypothetical protein
MCLILSPRSDCESPSWQPVIRAAGLGTFRPCDNAGIKLDHSGNNVTKDELRAELERQEQRYKEVYGGEVTTYAAQPEPERKPWRKRASLLDQAFKQELQKMEQELKEEP